MMLRDHPEPALLDASLQAYFDRLSMLVSDCDLPAELLSLVVGVADVSMLNARQCVGKVAEARARSLVELLDLASLALGGRDQIRSWLEGSYGQLGSRSHLELLIAFPGYLNFLRTRLQRDCIEKKMIPEVALY